MLKTKVLMWYFNHLKHIRIQCGENCDIGGLDIASCGNKNSIVLGDNVRLLGVRIKIFGNNNKIVIGDNNCYSDINIAIEDDNNTINIGKDAYIGSGLLAALEGTSLTIGSHGMIAGGVEIRTSDSHSIIDSYGNRLNRAKDIRIGNHVWVGGDVIVLKGTTIPDNCVVAAKSLVASSINIKQNSLIGGVPARVIKSEINWAKEKL